MLLLAGCAAPKKPVHARRYPPPPPIPPRLLPFRTVTLAWNPQPDASGFRLYWATNSFTPPLPMTGVSNLDVGPITSYSLNLIYGAVYCFSLTAYNTNGESILAPELTYTNLPPPPLLVGLRWPNRGVSPVIFWTNNLTDTLQWSPDLKNWTNIPSSFYTITPPECRVPISTNRWPARFFRVLR